MSAWGTKMSRPGGEPIARPLLASAHRPQYNLGQVVGGHDESQLNRTWGGRAELTYPIASDGARLAMNPFSSETWHRLYAQHIVGRDGRLVALPCARPGEQPWVLLDLEARSTWRPAANYYTSLFGPADDDLCIPGDVAALLRLVAGSESASPTPSVLELEPLCGPVADALSDGFRARGWYVRRHPRFGNWYLPCEGLRFENYMADRPSQLSSTWRRKSRLFVAGVSGTSIEIISSPQRVDAGIDAYEVVYARSWKKPEPYPAFIRAWAHACAERGWLRLGVAWVDGRPAAAQIWFTLGGKSHIFKLAYDEEFAKLSAGTVLTAALFRQALDDDRVAEIDYLTGDDAYKRQWMTHRRERHWLVACNPRRPWGLARAFLEQLRDWRARWRASKSAAAAA